MKLLSILLPAILLSSTVKVPSITELKVIHFCDELEIELELARHSKLITHKDMTSILHRCERLYGPRD